MTADEFNALNGKDKSAAMWEKMLALEDQLSTISGVLLQVVKALEKPEVPADTWHFATPFTTPSGTPPKPITKTVKVPATVFIAAGAGSVPPTYMGKAIVNSAYKADEDAYLLEVET